MIKWINKRATSQLLIIALAAVGFGCNSSTEAEVTVPEKSALTIAIPTQGNTWVVNNDDRSANVITKNGVEGWTDPASILHTYVRVEKAGALHIGAVAKVTEGSSTVKFLVEGQEQNITLTNTTADTIPVMTVNVNTPGYYAIAMQGVSTTASTFADIPALLVGGEATSSGVYYVKDDFYWGRRGPSVHLGYQVPEAAAPVKWFYNEMTVPEGEDVIGSYFMANGFGQGYFGIQVNSPDERRILFSVWSPYHTDNPNEIPEDQRIQLLKKGEGVHTGKFGNEGSGGQSYRKYMWKAGTTYRFLLKGEPAKNNSTDFTAYFYAPEIGKWELIASFRRPKTSTYLTRQHSFLENFIPQMGYKSRKVNYTNQWVCDKEGNWFELTKAKFTADATAHKDSRLDYAGGNEGSQFFLKNCGFFSERVPFDTFFERTPTGNQPQIDFSALP